MMDILVVGAGFSGCVAAERLASAGKRVLVIDKRSHVAGNAFDEKDEHGVLVHRYGPHIFHTNSRPVFNYLSRFTEWIPYEHRVLAFARGSYYPFPINRTTLSKFYGLELGNDARAEDFLKMIREPRAEIKTSEDYVVSAVGRELCSAFFRGYTKKQWGLDLKDLSPSVAGRIPVRTNDDDRYFTDALQAMPQDGYTKMFKRMLDHKSIRVETGIDFKSIRTKFDLVIYTGPLDEYFGCCYGKLPYRSLRFEHEHHEQEFYQPVGQVNYPNNFDYTRITEFKRITGQKCEGTSIAKEYSTSEGDPYYPIPTEANQQLAAKYKKLAEAERNAVFMGRLGCYAYYNMDQAVAASMKKMAEVLG